MKETCNPAATIVTDGFHAYHGATESFAKHEIVRHSEGEYVNENGSHTNTAESFFALLKRGIHGTFHDVSKQHLGRYCDEFSCRWNGRKFTDTERRDDAVKGAEGKRLTYKSPISDKTDPS